MSRVVLSIGSNVGDRLARLQAVVDALADSVIAVSPVFETDAWGGVDQGPFLNAVVIAEDRNLDAQAWLGRAQQIEVDNDRVRREKWGPRTLDVDLVCCYDGDSEVFFSTGELNLPHPLAHQRAFVLIPWLAVEPGAQLNVDGRRRPVREWLEELDESEREGVRAAAVALVIPEARP